MHFTERSPLEAGFSDVFDAQIRPKLIELEHERKTTQAKGMRQAGYVIAGTVALLLLIWLIFGLDTFARIAPVAGILGVAGAIGIWAFSSGSWQDRLATELMPIVCAHVGDLEYAIEDKSVPVDIFREMNLVPKHSNARIKAKLSGTYANTHYEIANVNLTDTYYDSENRRKTQTVFAGLLFRISVPVDAPGQITLMRDHGGFGNKLAETFSFGGARSLPKVSFEHEAFEAAFEVYAQNPDQAKAFMPPAFLDALLAIGDEQGQGRGAQAFVAAFNGKTFYLALSRSSSFLDLGGINRSLADIEDKLHGVFDDIEISHRVIDRLHGL